MTKPSSWTELERAEPSTSTLAGRLAPRAAGAALMETPAGPLCTPGDLVSGHPHSAFSSETRIALWVADPRALVASLLALDGAVGSLLLVSPAQPIEVVAGLVRKADCSVLVTDRVDIGIPGVTALTPCDAAHARPVGAPTRWLMTTSGTTGAPTIVAHDLTSLSRSVGRLPTMRSARWGLLYDPTRFAGMQVVLQALIGGGTLIAPDTAAPLAEQVAFLASKGCSHLSATPTLWRRLLMVPGHAALPLRQVTLGGEIADQPVLDALAATFPRARVTHIYASTEAGVGFSVNDGRAGFPTSHVEMALSGVAMRVDGDGIVWLRPPGRVPSSGAEIDGEGYVRSGDRVERRGDRFHFLGRDNGTINVGGVKVHPEAVERVIASVPGVALAKVSSKASPITGALLTAEIALAPGADPAGVKAAVHAACRARLDREAVPARVLIVDDLAANAAGKLVRRA